MADLKGAKIKPAPLSRKANHTTSGRLGIVVLNMLRLTPTVKFFVVGVAFSYKLLFTLIVSNVPALYEGGFVVRC